MTDADKAACIDGIRPYLDDCKQQSRKICDLRTYIVERRWERFAVKKRAAEIELIKPNTPEWHRWREYLVAVGDEKRWRTMEYRERRGLPFDAPSRWPPALPAEARTQLDKAG